METLDKVIRAFVETKYAVSDEDLKPELKEMAISPEYIKTVIEEKIKERIIDEVKIYAKEDIDQYAKKTYAEAKNAGRIAAIKQLLWEGFIVAIFVGLLGNEVTTLVNFFKNSAGEPWQLIMTIGLIVIYATIVLGLYIIKFTKDLIRTFTRRGTTK